MNYFNIYSKLIDRAKTRELPNGYVEKHHIVPKCMGGNNDPSNLATLTAGEHYVAHQLLVKMYPENGKLLFAAHMMTRSNGKHIRNNKEYSWLRKRRGEYLSKISLGVKRGKNTYVISKKLNIKYSYLKALQIHNFQPLVHHYSLSNMERTPVSPRDVLDILSIVWTYDK